jgi:hypothetical protein
MVNSTHDMTEDIGQIREAEDGRLVMVTRDCEWLRLPAMALDAAGIAALREVLDVGVEEIQGYQEYTADDEAADCPEGGCTHLTPGNPAPCDRCQRAEMEDAEEELAPEVLRDMLLLAGITIPVAVIIADWTPDQRREAATWAAAEHLNASDNDVERLPRPSFLPAGI